MTSRIATGPAPRSLPLAYITAGLLDPPADIRVTDVALDSRSVRPGALFLACRGAARHGLAFADQAVAAGARAILYESDPGAELPPAALEAVRSGSVYAAAIERLSQQAGAIAGRFFGEPSERLTVAAITGTNGKTTSAYLLAQAFERAGRPAGYLGTLGAGVPGAIRSFGLTTADAVSVQRQLAELGALGAECVAMEVSSHALEQGRVNGVRFRAAAFTNLTRDHLDFHGSMEAYGAAKARLFERELDARVLNIDDRFGLELARRFERAAGRLIVTTRRVGGPGSDTRLAGAEFVRADDVVALAAGSSLTIESSWGQARLTVPLIGDFNVENVLTVVGVLLSQAVPLERVAAVLGACAAPPGRMQIVTAPPGSPLAVVDYAHTPDALAKALRACRAHCRGKLRVVFGCGGGRDPGKRPLMGRAARELADEVVLTDDNPRHEDPQRIVADILEGMVSRAGVRVEHDRAAAIRGALGRSTAGDAVLIAGKGHEDCQVVGDERRPFSDADVAREFLSRPGGSP
jgi:UDP-N-acetylmuramoyl-L-alanyl-D-glutamate--2,6-diaminopimelate ligase